MQLQTIEDELEQMDKLIERTDRLSDIPAIEKQGERLVVQSGQFWRLRMIRKGRTNNSEREVYTL
jgi:hypothetical protein